jgi:molybdopterin molybdotransferase
MSAPEMSRLMPVEEAMQRLMDLAAAAPITERETVALADAEGRVLAEDLVSTLDLPPWPNSAMDGYAMRLADWTGEPLPVSQRIFAGQAPAPLQPGTCARIFTGAPVPEGADCVKRTPRFRPTRKCAFSNPYAPVRTFAPRGRKPPSVTRCWMLAPS